MKLLIAADMEGISGVVHPDHVNPSHTEYARFRRIMTADVNAAIAGARAAGVDEFVVADGHWDGTNILLEELDPQARLNSGNSAPFGMVEGIQSGVDAVFFIGYHARAGSVTGILDHTWSSQRIANLWLNGRLAGETGLNGAVCGAFGAPVLLVSGDQTVAAEAQEWIPGIQTAVVKQAGGRTSAVCLSLQEAHRSIHAAAARAVALFKQGLGAKPLILETPVTVTVEFIHAHMADSALLLPGAVRLDGRRVEFSAPDMPAAYRSFRAVVALAGR